MASGRIKGITIEIGGDTTKLVSSLKGVDSQIKTTQTALKDVNKLLKVDPSNVELLRQKQTALNESVALTKDRLSQLKDAQSSVAQGTAEWDALQREIIETEQNLESLERETKEFGSVTAQQIKAAGAKFQEVGGKIEAVGKKLAGLSAAAAGGLGAIGKLGYDAVTAADDLNTLSKQTGVSTDELQKWKYAADLVDVDVNTITDSMKKMKKGLESNADTFAELGVQTKDGSGNLRDATDIFYDTIAALSQIDNETERDIVAMQLFGKGADDLAGIIDDGGAALKAYGEEAEQMGLIIGGDTLNRLNDVNDTIDKLKATFGASLAEAGATIAETFAPALEKVTALLSQASEYIRNLTPEQVELITTVLAVVAALSPVLVVIGKLVSLIGFVMQNITAIQAVLAALTGPIGIAIAAIGALVAAFIYFYNTSEEFRDIVNGVIENVKNAIVKFVDKAKQAIKQLVDWLSPIISSVKNMVSALVEFVKTLMGALKQSISAWIQEHKTQIDMFMTTVKTIIKVGMDVVKGVVNTVLTFIRNYFSTVFNVIASILRAFTALLNGDFKGAMEAMKTAVKSAVDGVLNMFKGLYDGIKSILSNIIGHMKDWGREMIDSLVAGITEKISAVKDAIGNVAEAISERIHFSEPDEGPLKNFHTFMPDMINEMVKGINAGVPKIENAMSNMASAMVPGALQNGGTVNNSSNTNNITLTVYGAQGQNVNQLADIIQHRINQQVQQNEAVFA